jgi:catechol 2,3-dioxygenase-like lactoylglutathione lyase family enzyme
VRITQVFGGIPVRDLAPSEAWYARLFGRPPDMRPHDAEVCWRLADSGWIHVVVDPERAGNSLLTVLVDDLQGFLAGIDDRGFEPELQEIRGKAHAATFTDPDGNRITVGQPTG